jgi:hypothetical protein
VQQQQQQHSQWSQGSVGTKQQRQRVVIPGLDLDLAKQLVKNAQQVKQSRDRRTSYSQQQPQSSYYSQQQVDDLDSNPVREITPTPFVESGALTPPGDDTSSMAPSIQEQAAEVLSKALAAELRRSLPGLPGVPSDTLPAFPLTLSPVNMDQIMAAIISNAGNTPTGPLARGARQGDAHLFDDAAIQVLRAAAAERLAAAELAQPGQEHKALLEPIVPAPLGMGVRVSETVAHGISPSTLRHSLEAHLRQLQTTSTTATHSQSQRTSSRAHTTAAGGGGAHDNSRLLHVSLATAAQGPTPTPSYREEEQHEIQVQQSQQQQRQLQQSMAYTEGSYGGCLNASYATSIDKSRMTGVDKYNYNTNNNGDGSYASRDFAAASANNFSGGAAADHVSNLRLSGSRQSGLKSGSVREVHSSLAQERIARWNSSQFHGGSNSGY